MRRGTSAAHPVLELKSSTANKMNEFQAVRIDDLGLRPARSGRNGAVEFDRDTIGLQFKGFDELRDGGTTLQLREDANLAVEDNF